MALADHMMAMSWISSQILIKMGLVRAPSQRCVKIQLLKWDICRLSIQDIFSLSVLLGINALDMRSLGSLLQHRQWFMIFSLA